MRSFEIHPDVADMFPSMLVCFVVASGVRNDEPWPAVEEDLATLERAAADGSWTIESQATGTSSWHEAYRRFGTNPKRMRPSMEALARRLDRKHELPRISGAVDSYNAVSVRHGVPAGAFDLDGLPGDVVVRRADAASDEFVPLGEPDAVEHPTDGEVVYASGSRILTRSWNYRDSDLTKVVPASTSIVFMVERATEDGCSRDALVRAQEALAASVKQHADTVRLALLEPSTPRVDIGTG